ncbi:MAG: FHA domain-containing protein [Anaerolineae bacterium]|nr:FHA domain-containing protein [Anaerolineae bacterium]
MVRAAFEARTDTLATWATLQKQCLLLEADKARSKSALSDRLRKVQDDYPEEDDSDALKMPSTMSKQKSSVIRRLNPNKQFDAPENRKTSQTPDYLRPVSPPVKKGPSKPLKRLSSTKPLREIRDENRFWFTVLRTGRHIALPINGEISFGRFDPNVGIPPDIDLSFEDRGSKMVSRRHALIIGRNAEHRIEDLGSRAGIFLNGTQVDQAVLKPRDHISLGGVKMIYDKIPPEIFQQAIEKRTRHILTVTPTGRKFHLDCNKKILIGRKDTSVNFLPDIDLSADGDVARLVSRRHAIIRWRYSQPFIEDLGSSFGTRLRGDVLSLGQMVPLKPGDHIWLAGCVLAYDIET